MDDKVVSQMSFGSALFLVKGAITITRKRYEVVIRPGAKLSDIIAALAKVPPSLALDDWAETAGGAGIALEFVAEHQEPTNAD